MIPSGDCYSVSLISPREKTSAAPLSFSQQRLWFLEHLDQESSAYTIPFTLSLHGHLDFQALEKSIEEILRRHDVLRATFPTAEGLPVQRILPATSFTLPQVDLTALPEEQKKSELQRITREGLLQPFDLIHGPLVRIMLLRKNRAEHELFLAMHQLVFDRRSIGVFCRELGSLYETFSTGRPSSLPELSVQYSDFAAWQRQRLQGEVLDQQLSFWKHEINGLSKLQLPLDRSRPPVQSFVAGTHSFQLPRDLTESLLSLSRQQDSPLSMVLLSAFYALLHRYTGQNDIVLGVPADNRTHQEIDGLIGFLENSLVIRIDTSGNPVFRELLSRVKIKLLAAYAHQDLPFEKLVSELQSDRDLSHSPLYQVMFSFSHEPDFSLHMSGLQTTALKTDITRTRFDLSIHLTDDMDGLKGTFEFNSDLFNKATIGRMAGHYQRMLEGIVVDPDQRLSELPLLTEAEQHQLLVQWNDTATDYPRDRFIHELFEEQAEKTPEATAVVFEDQHLTYGELNAKAGRLAVYLKKQGVGPDVLVGICVERGLDMFIGILGILKAGGAYLPLDPSFPHDRLAIMIEDADPKIVLTQHTLQESLPSYDYQSICLDSVDMNVEEEMPLLPVEQPNLAYLIYTSGSTGKPKGVQIPHRAVVNLLISMRNLLGITKADTLLAVTTLSFDMSVPDLFLPLITGASIVIARRDVAADGEQLSELLTKTGTTVMQATPVTWQMLIQSGWKGSETLKVLIGGETLSKALAEQLMVRSGSLWNLYGPTETTVWSSGAKITAGYPITIGRPLANTQVYILDQYQKMVPIGVSGEICIGGDGLSPGYLNRPELTAEKFIPDPFSGNTGSRLYRTGDLARYLPDGNIEHLGRMDFQVKIRGFRIELGEIEALLKLQSAVRDAVVVTREDTPGDKRLVAYVLPHDSSQMRTDDLRSYLMEKLPNFMVPSAFVIVASFPLTLNAKVDRKALPAPDKATQQSGREFVPPDTKIERELKKIWESSLNLETIGVTDNFFELGGHSLLAVRLVSEIRKSLGIKIPVIAMFQFPTIRQLAGIIRKEGGAERSSSLIPIRPDGTRTPFFWIHGQDSDATLPKYLDTDQPLYGLVHQGMDGAPVRYQTVEEIAAHYLREIRTVHPKGPYYLGGYCFGGLIALEIAHQLSKQEDTAPLLFLLDLPSESFPSATSGNTGMPDTFGLRVNYHSSKILLLPGSQKITYVIRKIPNAYNWIISRIMTRVEKKVKLGFCNLLHRIGFHLPVSFRSFYLMDIYDRATRKYTPKPCAGRVVVCHSIESCHSVPPDTFTTGGVEIFPVHGSMHENLTHEPFVKIWGDYLNRCLRGMAKKGLHVSAWVISHLLAHADHDFHLEIFHIY